MFWFWVYIVGFIISWIPATVVIIIMTDGWYSEGFLECVGPALLGMVASLIWPLFWICIGVAYGSKKIMEFLESLDL